MADPAYEIPNVEKDIDEPVPASKLLELNEEKRILSSVYRHVEHQQAVEQVAGVAAGAIGVEKAFSVSTNESKSPSSPWLASLAQRTPSLLISAVQSEGSESISAGVHLRMSAGIGSTEAGDISRSEDAVKELIALTPSLDTALRLNMALQRRFRDRIQTLESVFNKNLERQVRLKDEISNANWMRERDQKTDGSGKLPLRISHFCVPYFKNRSGMPAPMNDDAKMKLNTGYIDLYVTRPRTWLTVEKETMDKVVREEWKEQNISSSEMSIREMQRKLQNTSPDDEETVKSLETSIKNLQDKVDKLRETPASQVMPDRGEKRLDWDRIAARAFDGHRTSEECQMQWENLLHPSINTSPFMENEDLVIQKMMMNTKAKVQDWEKMASELRSGRTGFLVMQRYVSFIEPTMKPSRWTKKDSDKLLHTVNMLRVGNHIPWCQVHQHLVGFSRSQIQSRWRMINPEMSKGPFTVEEDFLLIKGLHMFGLNIESITHFMPGRTSSQVRERYKRTILPGLYKKPWTKEEDDIIIRECSVGSRNWRKMIMELPRFNACEIRSRYHILQVWQTLSGTNMIPPPLFPITSTVDPESVQEIRKAMFMESSDSKKLVDASRKGIKLKNVVKELEERRLLIKERKLHNNLQKMKKVTEKRGRQAGVPNPHFQPVQDIFLTEYFIPSRPKSFYPCLSSDKVQKSLKVLCEAFQLNILKRVTASEADQLSALRVTPQDIAVVGSLIKNHVLTDEKLCVNNCPACERVRPEKIPLLPPCKTTIGAFRSLLVHRPRLNEMASGEFFLYRYSRAELLRLNPSFKGKRCGRKSRENLNLQQEQTVPEVTGPSQQQVGNVSEAETSQDEDDAGTQCQSDQSASAAGNKKTSNQTTFHITRQADEGTKQRRSKVKRPSTSDASQGELKAYSRGTAIKPEPSDIPSTSSMRNIKLEVNGKEVEVTEVNPSSRSLSQEDKNAREASENLLFQRMLSIFYFPAITTLSEPHMDLIHQINEKVTSGDLVVPPNANKTEKKCSSILSKDDLEVEEQDQYIRFLNDVEVKHQELRRQKKHTGNANQESEGTSDIACPPEQEATAEMVKMEDDTAATNQDSSDEEKPLKKEDGRRHNKALASHFRKRNLKSLRRSLVMKKIWIKRREGCYPQRKGDRDKRNYNPRGSRTRNCARTDMIKPPEAPKPWNFPVGGPLRVQPQVPYVLSQEMLTLAFSESISSVLSGQLVDDDAPTSEVNVGVCKETETRSPPESNVPKRKGKRMDSMHHFDESLEVENPIPPAAAVKVQKSQPRTLSLGMKLKTKNFQPKKRKSLQLETNVVNAVVEVHAAMTDEPKGALHSKNKPGTDKSKVDKSLLSPPLETTDDVLESNLKVVTKIKGSGIEKTSHKATPVSSKEICDTSFQNLLEDTVEDRENVGEKRSLFAPEEATEVIEEEVTETPVKALAKKTNKFSYRKSFQASFQSLLDDPVEVQNNSSVRSPELSIDLPVKIQPLVQNPIRNAGSSKSSWKLFFGQMKKSKVASEEHEEFPSRQQQQSLELGQCESPIKLPAMKIILKSPTEENLEELREKGTSSLKRKANGDKTLSKNPKKRKSII